MIRRKKEERLGVRGSVLVLHSAFLLRLFLLSVRRLVHPALYSPRSLLKNAPIFLETDLFWPHFSSEEPV